MVCLWIYPNFLILISSCINKASGLSDLNNHSLLACISLNLKIFNLLSFWFWLSTFFVWPCPRHMDVLVPGIKPTLQQQPTPLQWQHLILNPLCHKGAPFPGNLSHHFPPLSETEVCLFLTPLTPPQPLNLFSPDSLMTFFLKHSAVPVFLSSLLTFSPLHMFLSNRHKSF